MLKSDDDCVLVSDFIDVGSPVFFYLLHMHRIINTRHRNDAHFVILGSQQRFSDVSFTKDMFSLSGIKIHVDDVFTH